jgi:hypothetical protein
MDVAAGRFAPSGVVRIASAPECCHAEYGDFVAATLTCATADRDRKSERMTDVEWKQGFMIFYLERLLKVFTETKRGVAEVAERTTEEDVVFSNLCAPLRDLCIAAFHLFHEE